MIDYDDLEKIVAATMFSTRSPCTGKQRKARKAFAIMKNEGITNARRRRPLHKPRKVPITLAKVGHD